MAEPAIVVETPAPVPDRLFSGLFQCPGCSTRGVLEIRRNEFFLLRRDGRLLLKCQSCGDWTRHRLIRIAT